jgi:hypothetical protein
MTSDPVIDRLALIRKAIEEAVPAEEYFAKQAAAPVANNYDIYQAHLDALTKEFDELIGEEYLNEGEARSIRSLVAFTAYNHNLSEQAVCAIVEEHFRIEKIRRLRSHDYDEVIKYLVDLNPKELIN